MGGQPGCFLRPDSPRESPLINYKLFSASDAETTLEGRTLPSRRCKACLPPAWQTALGQVPSTVSSELMLICGLSPSQATEPSQLHVWPGSCARHTFAFVAGSQALLQCLGAGDESGRGGQ